MSPGRSCLSAIFCTLGGPRSPMVYLLSKTMAPLFIRPPRLFRMGRGLSAAPVSLHRVATVTHGCPHGWRASFPLPWRVRTPSCMLVPKTSSGGIGMKRWTTKRTVVTVTVGLAMLLALGLIFGCGGSTQAPTPSASPSSEAATLQAYFDAMQHVPVDVEHATDVLLN